MDKVKNISSEKRQYIYIEVKTNAFAPSVKKINKTTYKVSTREKPIGGKANASVLAQIAQYLSIPKSRISILSGEKSKFKRLEIQ